MLSASTDVLHFRLPFQKGWHVQFPWSQSVLACRILMTGKLYKSPSGVRANAWLSPAEIWLINTGLSSGKGARKGTKQACLLPPNPVPKHPLSPQPKENKRFPSIQSAMEKCPAHATCAIFSPSSLLICQPGKWTSERVRQEVAKPTQQAVKLIDIILLPA
jgi:hypothetical protein